MSAAFSKRTAICMTTAIGVLAAAFLALTGLMLTGCQPLSSFFRKHHSTVETFPAGEPVQKPSTVLNDLDGRITNRRLHKDAYAVIASSETTLAAVMTHASYYGPLVLRAFDKISGQAVCEIEVGRGRDGELCGFPRPSASAAGIYYCPTNGDMLSGNTVRLLVGDGTSRTVGMTPSDWMWTLAASPHGDYLAIMGDTSDGLPGLWLMETDTGKARLLSSGNTLCPGVYAPTSIPVPAITWLDDRTFLIRACRHKIANQRAMQRTWTAARKDAPRLA